MTDVMDNCKAMANILAKATDLDVDAKKELMQEFWERAADEVHAVVNEPYTLVISTRPQTLRQLRI